MLMTTTTKYHYVALICSCLFVVSAAAETPIECFEYASDADMQAMWSPQGATLSLASYVSPNSQGTNSLRIDRNWPANAWETEVVGGQTLTAPLAILPAQYVTLRIAGNPQFANASYQQFFLYAYDDAGNFGRWGTSIPTTTNWQVVNIKASSIQAPWNSPGLPDLNNITRFSFYIYGQGDPPGQEFTATIYVDDIIVRDAPLIDFLPPAPMRTLLDDFEAYPDDAALLGFYSYENSPAATVTTASLATPAPQGNKALKLAVDFAAGQWPWGSVRSALAAPFSMPTNAIVALRLKGDPTLASVADSGTTFWLSFYDQAGRRFTYNTPAAAVISSEWTTLKASYNDFWADTVVDTGNLVQWRILLEGWQGTTDSQPVSAAIYVDDIRISIPPALAIVSDGGVLKLHMTNLIPGATYTIQMSTDFAQWTTTTVQATADTMTSPVPTGQQKQFFQLYYTP